MSIRRPEADYRSFSSTITKVSGYGVSVSPFHVQGFDFIGGSITMAAPGTWYVGPDLFSGELIALPRLGHRGFIPVAKVIAATDGTVMVRPIIPVMPKSRLPRTTKKILEGKTIKVCVIGSSLAEGGSGTTDWSGMLFNAASNVANYRLPATMTFLNMGLGGTPNEYQLAQVGYAQRASTFDYDDAGTINAILPITPPGGRSSYWSDVDLVVMTCLANGGDYRLEKIEPIIRQLRKMGIEVIVTTDNPQGAAQVGGTGPYVWAGGYSSITNGALYTDGPEVISIAENYKCEVADTAAYVVDAVLRYPTYDIYRDSIHMYSAAPNGRTGRPSGGYEVYARAIRSCINIDAPVSLSNGIPTTYNFASDVQGFTGYQSGVVTWDASGKLKCTKNNAASAQWGAWIDIPAVKTGDTVVVSATLTGFAGGYSGTPAVGLQGGGAGWGSNSVGGANPSNVVLTATRDILTGGKVLFFANQDPAPDQSSFLLDDVTITVNSSAIGAAYLKYPRDVESPIVAPIRRVADYKTPADCIVILPPHEPHLATNNNAGSLGASHIGASSFARRFSSLIGSTQDLLSVGVGQRAGISAPGAVGFSIIYAGLNGDPGCTFDVYRNNTFVKTITIGAQTLNREIVQTIYTPTELNKNSPSPNIITCDLRVTSGTLRIAALLALTMDMSFYAMEDVNVVGTWSKVAGPSLRSWATDTSQDYAYFKCPDDGGMGRVWFVTAAKSNTKNQDTWSGRTSSLNASATGQNHTIPRGGHVGPGDYHFIRAAAANGAVDQATNGYGLQVGGVIVVNDR